MDPIKAIILSAGQGSRLLPLTSETPKCLIDLGERSALGWQIEALVESGVNEIVVVTGYREEKVVNYLKSFIRPGLNLRTRYNPFYKLADNLATCWLVRDEFEGTCLLINGDTIFSADVSKTLLATPEEPITVTIDKKSEYDDDDMKVKLADRALCDIAKTLPLDTADGEAIGMIRMMHEGGATFAAELEREIRETEGPRRYYLSAIAALAQRGLVNTTSIEGSIWGEMDDHADLEAARKMVQHDAFRALVATSA